MGKMIRLPLDDHGHPIQVLKMGDVRSVAFDATATTIASVVGSSVVRLFATQLCHILLGASPTAATTDTPLAADTPEYVQAAPETDFVSVIGTLTTATARLWVTDCH